MQFQKPTKDINERYRRFRERLVRTIRPTIFRQQKVNEALDEFLELLESKFNHELMLHEVRMRIPVDRFVSFGITTHITNKYAIKQFERLLRKLIQLGRRLAPREQQDIARKLILLVHHRLVVFQINFF